MFLFVSHSNNWRRIKLNVNGIILVKEKWIASLVHAINWKPYALCVVTKHPDATTEFRAVMDVEAFSNVVFEGSSFSK